MTISSSVNRIAYTGDGTSTAFAFPFRIFAASDLQVFLGGALQSSGYSVAGVDSVAGGTCTFSVAPGSGVAVVLRRAVPFTQPVDYRANDAFPAETHERALDRVVVLAQQANDRADTALRVPDDETIAAYPVAAARAGKIMGFDSAGAPTLVAITGSTVTVYAQWAGTAAGTANARTLAPTPALGAYAAGVALEFINGAAANTGPATLNVSGLGAVAIVRPDGTALAAGDMPASALLTVRHDGTSFRLVNLVPGVSAASETVAGVAELATQAEADAATDDARTLTPLKLGRWRRPPLAQASAYTVVAADHRRLITCTGTWTLSLTAGATLGSGFEVLVRNVGAGLVTIDPAGSETIDGDATLVLPARFGGVLVWTGSEWLTTIPAEVRIAAQVTSGSAGLVDFTLPSADLNYRLRYTNLSPANSEVLLLRWSTDGGATFLAGGTDYHRSGTYNGAATATGFGDLGGTAITLTTTLPAGGVANGFVEFFPGAAGQAAAVLIAQAGLPETTNTYLRTLNVNGRRSAAGAVNAVRLLVATGNFNAGGRVSLYGLRP